MDARMRLTNLGYGRNCQQDFLRKARLNLTCANRFGETEQSYRVLGGQVATILHLAN
jgi:hypothetical protein